MRKSEDEPLAICGARSKRTGNPCRQPPMKNGRCRLHGGKSTGPKTKEGLLRSKRANWKHGMYSVEFRQQKEELRKYYEEALELMNKLK